MIGFFILFGSPTAPITMAATAIGSFGIGWILGKKEILSLKSRIEALEKK